MSIRAYKWFGVAVHAGLGLMLYLFAINKLAIDPGWIKPIAWTVAIGYIIGGVIVVIRERRKNAQEAKISDENVNENQVRENNATFRLADVLGSNRKLSVPVSLLLGGVMLVFAASYHWKFQRDKAACFELINAARADLEGAATPLLDLYLNDKLDPSLAIPFTQLENVYGLSFRECKKAIGG